MSALLEKLTAANKRNEIGQHRLLRELSKLEEVEKSDLRMLETARHRFRSRFKKFEVPPQSSGSDAIDVRMYDTHNPGFCYHCTGAIKSSGSSPRETTKDTFNLVHSMLFTNGEVDPDKVLCLHLLAAHSVKLDSSEPLEVKPVTALLEKGRRQHFTGAWNNILPCYVVDVRGDFDYLGEFSEELKYHKDPRVRAVEDETIADFETKYKKYLEENSDIEMALAANGKMSRMVPSGLGKMPIISPHIYSLLGAAQEFKIKQAIADGSTRRRFKRSSMDFERLDEKSLSFRLDDDDDLSGRLTANTSNRGWGLTAGLSKVSSVRSPSRRSATGSYYRLDPSITTLKHRSGRGARPVEEFKTVVEDKDQEEKEVITIKPSCRIMRRIASKTSSTKSPFHNILNKQFSTTRSNSFTSGGSGRNTELTKCKRCIYLNSPVRSLDLRDKEYRTVPILVNNQIQALVHSVLDVLERVNPEKMQKIVLTARDPYEIRKMMVRPDIQLFVDSLMGQPLVSSPDSFVISTATVVDEIDPRFERSLEKELIALTLDMPPAPSLDLLVREIRNNLFHDPNKGTKLRTKTKVETIDNLKGKFQDKSKINDNARTVEEKELTKRVFDLTTSCTHTDFLSHKTSCACCYSKWKESPPHHECTENSLKENVMPDKSMKHDEIVVKIGMKPSRNVNKATGETKTEIFENVQNNHTLPGQDRKIAASVHPKKDKNKMQPSSKETVKLPKIDGLTEMPEKYQVAAKNPQNDLSVKAHKSKLSKAAHSPIQLSNKQSNYKMKKSENLPQEEKLEASTAQDAKSRSSGQYKTIKSSVSRESRNYMDTKDTVKARESAMTIGSVIIGKFGRVYNANPLSYSGGSKITLPEHIPTTPKCQFKPWKVTQDPGYLDPDRVILRRMTNTQRILVGQMCASLKTRRINTQGLVKERTPLAALITPVLSHESIRILTRGTGRMKPNKIKPILEEKEETALAPDKLTGPVLAKVRQEVAENETDRRLRSFLNGRT